MSINLLKDPLNDLQFTLSLFQQLLRNVSVSLTSYKFYWSIFPDISESVFNAKPTIMSTKEEKP